MIDTTTKKKRVKLALQDREEVEPMPVPWLVYPYVIRGAGTLISGKPGTGKSTFAAALASALSRGEDMAGNKIDAGPQQVMYLELEEDPAWVIRPTLDANNAAPHSIKLPVKSQMDGTLTLADPEIVDYAVATGCTVVVLSPLTSFFGALSMNDATVVKPLLQGFLDKCSDAGIATIFLHHTTKAAAGSDISSPAGSMQIAGTFRLMFNVYGPSARFGDTSRYRWIVPVKCNVGTAEPLSICTWTMAPDDTGIPRVMRWLGRTDDKLDDVCAGVAGVPKTIDVQDDDPAGIPFVDVANKAAREKIAVQLSMFAGKGGDNHG